MLKGKERFIGAGDSKRLEKILNIFIKWSHY
jgi:hypothetical protein